MRSFLIVLAFASVSSAGSVTLGHVASGGGWKTLFAIENMSETESTTATFVFRDDSGQQWNVSLIVGGKRYTGYYITIPVGPKAVVFGETEDGQITTEGWASVNTMPYVSVTASFRFTMPGQPEAEAAAHLTTCSPNVGMPFDNTNGFATGMAVANGGSDPLFLVIIYDETGKRITNDLLTVPAAGHTAFLVADRFPITAGVRGSIELHKTTTSGGFGCLLGLSFNPSGTFTTLNAASF